MHIELFSYEETSLECSLLLSQLQFIANGLVSIKLTALAFILPILSQIK